MKHLMLTLGLVTALTAGLSAQEPMLSPSSEPAMLRAKEHPVAPSERAKKDAARAEKELGLSNDQKMKWEAASLERAAANQPIREKMKGCTTPQERKDLRGQMTANKKKYNTTVLALLTPDQKSKYEQLRKEKQEARKAKMKKKREHMREGRN